jgi:hypothetical protein
VPRDTYDQRRNASRQNLEFFGAPHVPCYIPKVGDNVRVVGDIGMYAQTFLLSLTAHGLGVNPSLKLLFGISFRYPDETSPANGYRIGKVPITHSVTFYS